MVKEFQEMKESLPKFFKEKRICGAILLKAKEKAVKLWQLEIIDVPSKGEHQGKRYSMGVLLGLFMKEIHGAE